MPKPPANAATWDSLISAAPDWEGKALKGARRLPLAALDPHPAQPRQHTDPALLEELAADIAARGILEPLIVRAVGERYQIIAGGRRYAAAVIAQLELVPALIVEMDDAAARDAAIAENIHREDLDVEDEARYYVQLEGDGMSARDIARAIHKSHSYVLRRLRLLREPGALDAYRAGLRGLQEDREAPTPPPEVVPMPETPALGTERSTSQQSLTPTEPRAPSWHVYFDRAWAAARNLPVERMAPAERAILRQKVADLQYELTQLAQQLQED